MFIHANIFVDQLYLSIKKNIYNVSYIPFCLSHPNIVDLCSHKNKYIDLTYYLSFKYIFKLKISSRHFSIAPFHVFFFSDNENRSNTTYVSIAIYFKMVIYPSNGRVGIKIMKINILFKKIIG